MVLLLDDHATVQAFGVRPWITSPRGHQVLGPSRCMVWATMDDDEMGKKLLVSSPDARVQLLVPRFLNFFKSSSVAVSRSSQLPRDVSPPVRIANDGLLEVAG